MAWLGRCLARIIPELFAVRTTFALSSVRRPRSTYRSRRIVMCFGAWQGCYKQASVLLTETVEVLGQVAVAA